MTLPAPVITVMPVPEGEKLGYIGKLVVAGDDLYATGGTYHAPTLLRARAGGAFERWMPPKTSGLRGLYVDGKRIIVVGEYGMIAATSNGGERWTRLSRATSGKSCLYSIDRDPSGAFWVTGDAGLVLRGPINKLAPVRTLTDGRVLGVWIDPTDGKPWLLDTTGILQRWTGKKFVEVPVPAQKSKASMNEITRTRSNAIVTVANHGGVLRSGNDGATWKRSPTHVLADLETIHVTRYGIFAAGDKGTLVGSWDDAQSFTAIETGLTDHLWTIASVPGAILIGGDEGRIYRIEVRELARLLHAVYAGRVEKLAAIAKLLEEGAEGAEMVWEDAMRERGQW